jgi:putative exporter of polyketide antibiotics
VKKLEAKLLAECGSLLCDFAHEVTEAWKGWLTGSLPMTAMAISALVDPDWIRLPIWAWALAIFVAGLIAATFRVYRDLRKERDDLQEMLSRSALRGPFALVPLDDDPFGCRAIEEVRRDV